MKRIIYLGGTVFVIVLFFILVVLTNRAYSQKKNDRKNHPSTVDSVEIFFGQSAPDTISPTLTTSPAPDPVQTDENGNPVTGVVQTTLSGTTAPAETDIFGRTLATQAPGATLPPETAPPPTTAEATVSSGFGGIVTLKPAETTTDAEQSVVSPAVATTVRQRVTIVIP